MPARSKSRKRRPILWDETKYTVLDLIFEGRKTHSAIAEDCGVPTRTLEDWIAHPDFQARLQERRASLIESLDQVPYIRKERRLMALAQMAENARQHYEARPWLREIRPLPAKAVVRIKTINTNGDEEIDDTEPIDAIVNESFNRDAFAAWREALSDIAKELGERSSNVKISGTLAHSLVPHGEAKALADDLLDAVRYLPDARAALSARLLASGGE